MLSSTLLRRQSYAVNIARDVYKRQGFTLIEDPLRAGYYSEIDMLVWAKKFSGDEFVDVYKRQAHTMLNAGRGNPNWIATEPREAFFLLGKFGLGECRRVQSLEEGIAGIPQQEGIAARFDAVLKENEKESGARLLKETYNYMLMEHAADPDRLVHE